MIFSEMTNALSHLFFVSYIIVVIHMKKILLKDYKKEMGEFIDVNYNASEIQDSALHIPYEKLLINHKELLDKNKKYFIYCNGGIKSRKAVNILEFYGYDVTLVYHD